MRKRDYVTMWAAFLGLVVWFFAAPADERATMAPPEATPCKVYADVAEWVRPWAEAEGFSETGRGVALAGGTARALAYLFSYPYYDRVAAAKVDYYAAPGASDQAAVISLYDADGCNLGGEGERIAASAFPEGNVGVLVIPRSVAEQALAQVGVRGS